MPISNGFSSKVYEKTYIKLTENLIELLSDRILKALSHQPSDDQIFARLLVSIYTKMGRLEVSKIMSPKLSNCFHDLSTYLASLYPGSRCTSSESSHSRSDNSQPSPIPFDSGFHPGKSYLHQPLALDEIEEEDPDSKQDSLKTRFHSQPRKAREVSPTKNAFKLSLQRNYAKTNTDDVMGKYLKMSEKFSEKKGKKEESLYFSNGIFFHIP